MTCKLYILKITIYNNNNSERTPESKISSQKGENIYNLSQSLTVKLRGNLINLTPWPKIFITARQYINVIYKLYVLYIIRFDRNIFFTASQYILYTNYYTYILHLRLPLF